MPATNSRRSKRLIARPSPYHSSVTLFDVSETIDHLGSDSGSRSTEAQTIKLEESSSVPDLEDIVSENSTIPDIGMPTMRPPSPKVRIRARNSSRKTTVKTEAVVTRTSEEDTKTNLSKKSKVVKPLITRTHPAPPNWRQTYDMICEMRSRVQAPVDTMGCDQEQVQESDPKNKRFSTLIALMLSPQAKDESVDAAVKQLRIALGGSLSPDALRQADDVTIQNAIRQVGLWRKKAEYIKQAAQTLYEKFESDVPNNLDDLRSLNGVGAKIAILALQSAWKNNVGIGVDTHVHRITNRLGWHKPPTTDPEVTRANLESWLPKEFHPQINHLLVGFGQMICLPTGPRCDLCTLSTAGLCPSASSTVNSKNRSPRKAGAAVKIEVEVKPSDMLLPVVEDDEKGFIAQH